MPLEKVFCEWEGHARQAFKACDAPTLRPLISEIENKLPRGRYLFLVTGSFGDVIPNLFLIEKFAELVNEQVVILTYASLRFFVKRLDSRRCLTKLVDDPLVPYLHRSFFSEGRVFFKERGRIFPTLLTLHPYIAEACITGRMLDYEAKRLLLSLPYGFEIPFRYDAGILELQAERLKSGYVEGAGLVISPLSNTNQSFSPLFLKKLIHILSADFRIIVNLGGASEERSHPYKKELENSNVGLIMNAPPHEIFEIVKVVGVHIGALNGLSGMLTMFDSTSKHIIIRESDLVNPSSSRSLPLGSFSELLGHDWNYKSKVLELVVSQEFLLGEYDLSSIQEEMRAFLELEDEARYLVKKIT